jgi:hypothetical protein
VVAELELPVDLFADDVPFGGISGLAFDPACGLLYAVSDDRGHIAAPRVYVLRIDPKAETAGPLEVVTLRDRTAKVFDPGVIDAESLALAGDGVLWVGTEGVSHQGIPPRILGFRLDGELLEEIEIPQDYHPSRGRGVRSNHGFEGLSITPDGSRIIAAVESTLLQDGPEATLDRGAVVRIAVFDLDSRQLVVERAYALEPVPDVPDPPTAYRSTGVAEILALDRDRILVVERSFSAGVGNRVRLFVADLSTGDDVTGAESLAPGVRTVDKALVADLADIGIDPDNLEGMALGPRLPDGRSTLILASDNNFQPDVQRNQLLVLALRELHSRAAQRSPATVAEIQASAHVSPFVGRCVSGVEGTVTAILGQSRGQAFWIQQQPGDDDPATSEGLFVTALDGVERVEIGDAVRLTGRVEEPRWAVELPVTRLVADGLEITGRKRPLPPPVVMGEAGRPIPSPVIDDDSLTHFEPEADAIDFYESLEGMRVRVEKPVVVGPTSRHGEIVVLPDDGSGSEPRSAVGGIVLMPGNAHPERIVVDDRLIADPPAVAVGDRMAGPIDGVLHYSYGSFKLLNTSPLTVERPSGGTPTVTSLVADRNHVTVATFNVENLSAVSTAGKFDSVAGTIVSRLRSPSILALQEIQDDSGPVDDGTVTAGQTLGRLVDAVVSAGGPRYRWIQVDPADNADGGKPGANIRVALLVDPARASLPSPKAPRGEGSAIRLGETDPAFSDSRKPLAVTMAVDGEWFTFIVCHLRSKGGDDPLFGRRQPPLRSSEAQRLPQAELIRRYVDRRLEESPPARVVVLGDLNDFEFSDSVGMLAAPPMVNLMDRLPDADRWTYVYGGNSQSLDHVIVSPILAAGAEIEAVHVNSIFPLSGRASDHDPVIARISLGP